MAYENFLIFRVVTKRDNSQNQLLHAPAEFRIAHNFTKEARKSLLSFRYIA